MAPTLFLSLILAFLSLDTRSLSLASPIPEPSIFSVPDTISSFWSKVTNKPLKGNPALLSQPIWDDIVTFRYFAYYARAAYYPNSDLNTWKCGKVCDIVPETEVFLTGGDNAATPQYFVAFDHASRSVVVSYRGTNSDSLLSVWNDVQVYKITPDEEHVPGARENGILIHQGFYKTFKRTADVVLDKVRQIIEKYQAKQVKITGHSLGAAVAILVNIYLRAKLSAEIDVQTVVFGNPRVGNSQFAKYVDARAPITHIHSGHDPVVVVPATYLGYQHPSNEIYIDSTDTPRVCPGQENPNCSASNLWIKDLLDGDAKSDLCDHAGPYFGIPVGLSEMCSIVPE